MRWLVALSLLGCLNYRAGSFSSEYPSASPWPATHVTLSCLDVAIGVSRTAPAPGPVVHYAFGNRCARDVVVDVPAVRVTARDASGRELVLAAYDPSHEIRTASLPALRDGSEDIAYDGDFAERELVEVCVDVGALERDAHVERWLCSGERLEAAR